MLLDPFERSRWITRGETLSHLQPCLSRYFGARKTRESLCSSYWITLCPPDNAFLNQVLPQWAWQHVRGNLPQRSNKCAGARGFDTISDSFQRNRLDPSAKSDRRLQR